MEVLYFLKERLNLIRHFYDAASAPFSATKRQIEDEEPPFEPPYSEDGEPTFLTEWLQADTELEVLGRACVSMLSDSLKLYFLSWERDLWVEPPCGKCFPAAFRKGFLPGYLACFGEALGIEWKDCPADLNVLEQVILARNRSQHPVEITSLDVTHDQATRDKHPNLFFAQPTETDIAAATSDAGLFMLHARIHVSRDRLFQAIDETEKLAGWLEERMFARKYRRATPASE